MLRFRLDQGPTGRLWAMFDTEPEPRKWLLTSLLHDFDRQEDLVLREIAKAEAGETILDLYNNYIDVQLYPDGRVILESLPQTAGDDEPSELPDKTEITLKEARQLILDWLEAKKKWYAEHPKAKAG